MFQEQQIFKLKPEILTHPNIPKALHGTNPRTLFGECWWDKKRQEAYTRYDYHCISCGVHKSNAKKHRWLEAHEFYEIDYNKGRVEIKSIEPLCHYCHNFIHSGRLKMIMNKQKSIDEIKNILTHGFEILSKNNLQCFYYTLEFAKELDVNTLSVQPYEIIQEKPVKWEDWRLIIDGKSYKGQFNSFEDWRKFYSEAK